MDPIRTHNHKITRGFLPYINLEVKESIFVMILLLGGMYSGSVILPVPDWMGYILGAIPGLALYFYLRFYSLGKPPNHAIDTVEGLVIDKWIGKNQVQSLFPEEEEEEQ